MEPPVSRSGTEISLTNQSLTYQESEAWPLNQS